MPLFYSYATCGSGSAEHAVLDARAESSGKWGREDQAGAVPVPRARLLACDFLLPRLPRWDTAVAGVWVWTTCQASFTVSVPVCLF